MGYNTSESTLRRMARDLGAVVQTADCGYVVKGCGRPYFACTAADAIDHIKEMWFRGLTPHQVF